MVMFNSYVSLPEGNSNIFGDQSVLVPHTNTLIIGIGSVFIKEAMESPCILAGNHQYQ